MKKLIGFIAMLAFASCLDLDRSTGTEVPTCEGRAKEAWNLCVDRLLTTRGNVEVFSPDGSMSSLSEVENTAPIGWLVESWAELPAWYYAISLRPRFYPEEAMVECTCRCEAGLLSVEIP